MRKLAAAAVLAILTLAAIFTLAALPGLSLRGTTQSRVRLTRVPDGGLQPQAVVDDRGTVHLIYFKGDPAHGDIFYVRSNDRGGTFSSPVRVNSQTGSAIALGTIRGARLAVGRDDRMYVAWNGSTQALPKGPLDPEMPAGSPYSGQPMLFTRLNDAGTGFEPQRNLMRLTFGLDGGGSVAADSSGNVYVAWHGRRAGDPAGEDGRRVWIARSEDDGAHFSPEAAANLDLKGACGCCGLSLFADEQGHVYALYRTAHQTAHRDIDLLLSQDHGRSFRSRLVDPWNIAACPMSSMAFAQGPGFVDLAWQTRTEVYYAALDSGTLKMSLPVAAPGSGTLRKYPALAANSAGQTLLAWTDGTGWGSVGSVGWQIFDRSGRALGEEGSAPGLPAWSFGAAFARPGGDFTILY